MTGEDNAECIVGNTKSGNGIESIEHDEKFIEVVQNPFLKGQGKSSSN